MKLKVVFDNDAWFVGVRGFKESVDECKDFHHIKVLDACISMKGLIGKEVAIHVLKPSYFILNWKG
jgi:hypothetical protein